jgi:hypothetical protein
MSFVTLAIVNSALTSVEAAIREGKEIDAGVLGSFNAGISHLLLSGREPSNVEVAALQGLAAAIVPVPAQEEQPSGAGESVSVPSVAAAPVSEDQGSGEEGEEAPGEPETAGGVGAPQVSVIVPDAEAAASAPADGAKESLTEVHSDPITPAEELFQPQSHDEDDGA